LMILEVFSNLNDSMILHLGSDSMQRFVQSNHFYYSI